MIEAGWAAARTWGHMCADGKRRGRSYPRNDSWTAACCITEGLPLATLNVKHFEDMPTTTASSCSPDRAPTPSAGTSSTCQVRNPQRVLQPRPQRAHVSGGRGQGIDSSRLIVGLGQAVYTCAVDRRCPRTVGHSVVDGARSPGDVRVVRSKVATGRPEVASTRPRRPSYRE